ncbi:MAG: hypothetical protein Q9225_001287 [Loekoesia sp. 1 TL-2023]
MSLRGLLSLKSWGKSRSRSRDRRSAQAETAHQSSSRLSTNPQIRPLDRATASAPALPPSILKPSGPSAAPSGEDKLGLFCLTLELTEEQLDPHTPDIIAIHGINGGSHKTWKHENGKNWLKDFLPRSIGNDGARIFTFGYDASVTFTKSKSDIDDFARDLLNRVARQRRGKLSTRPLVFICHSMGGIVLKKVRYAASSTLDAS